ncbi:hypothetical protein Bca4012_058467 [Brassica carinata]
MLVAVGEESAMFVAFDAYMNKLENVMAPEKHGEQRTNWIQSPSIPTGHCWEDLHIPSQAY